MADYLTKEELNALLAERDKRSEETLVNTLKGFMEQSTAKFNETLNGALGRFEKESNSRFSELGSKLSIVDEIKAALEAPDPEPTPESSTPQTSTDFDRIIEERLKAVQDNYGKELSKATSQIKALQEAVDAERQEKIALTQKQIAEARRNGFINTTKKLAPEVGLFNDIEEALLLKLQADGVLKESEDGSSYLVETVQRDKYTGQENTVLAPIDAALPELLRSKYTQFLVPRSGFGSNATATQPYRQPSSRSAAELLDNVSSNSGDFDLDAIAAAISNG